MATVYICDLCRKQSVDKPPFKVCIVIKKFDGMITKESPLFTKEEVCETCRDEIQKLINSLDPKYVEDIRSWRD